MTNYLTRDIAGLTGGRMLLEENPVKAAEAIEDHILAKRKEIAFD